MPGFTQSLGLIGHMWRKEFTQCATSTLRFQTASDSLIGLLTVGAVIGTGVTVTDYVIEWRLGGTTGSIVLISGIGSDPAIQAFHPLVSEPVVGGELYAVIRYIVIDGVKYSPYFMQGQYSPDLLECLGSITVVTMNCNNGAVFYYEYVHQISYSNTQQPASLAERTLRFDLNSDGSTSYLVWYFYAGFVADRITISYVHIGDEANPIILSDWIVGYNTTSNFISSPYNLKSHIFRQITDLTGETFTDGDYLLIKITPGVEELQNPNTNWSLYLGCFNVDHCTTTAIPDGSNQVDPATVTMTWNSAQCQWEMKWKNINWYTGPELYEIYSEASFLGYIYNYDGAFLQALPVTEQYMAFFRDNISGGLYHDRYSLTCVQLDGSINIVKTGANLFLTFTSVTDYNNYKDAYDSILAGSFASSYSADPTSYNHYKWWYLPIMIAPTCGDTILRKDMVFYYSSTITWDDVAMTMEVDMVNVAANGITEVACDTTHQQIDAGITQCQNSINLTDFNTDIVIADTAYIWDTVMHHNVVTATFVKEKLVFAVADQVELDGCFPEGWGGSSYYGYDVVFVTATITDVADPAGNFRLENWLNADGTVKLVSEIVYEMEDGVQIIP